MKNKSNKNKQAPKPRNEHAFSLFLRAGNAGCAVAVDTRPKVFKASGENRANKRITPRNYQDHLE